MENITIPYDRVARYLLDEIERCDYSIVRKAVEKQDRNSTHTFIVDPDVALEQVAAVAYRGDTEYMSKLMQLRQASLGKENEM